MLEFANRSRASMYGGQFRPQLKYEELRPTESVVDKIPRDPYGEQLQSFEAKSALNAHLNHIRMQGQQVANADMQKAQM